MYSLFRLLFTKGYWRNLASGEFWRRIGPALRRAHKDRRARKQLRTSLVLLIAPLFCLVYLLWFVGVIVGAGPFGLTCVIVFLACVIAGEIIRRRKREAKKRTGQGADPERRPPPPLPSSELRREFADLTLLHAVFADRAGSEQFLHTKILPEGIEIVTRRVQLDLLRDRGLYDRLDPIVLGLLLRADGHWTPSDCNTGALALEPLRVLRWCLRLDHYLPTVGESLRLSYDLASATVKDPGALFRGTDFISYGTLNIAFRAAANFMHRCYAEAVHRKLMQPSNDVDAARCRRIFEKFRHDEHKDLVLGSAIVSKATDSDVLHARLLAARRYHLLSWVAHLQYGDFPPPEALNILFLDPPQATDDDPAPAA
jgi:hypothetical protein